MELEDYNDYCRQELPRVVRDMLARIVNLEEEPKEHNLLDKLEEIVKSAQHKVYENYKTTNAFGIVGEDPIFRHSTDLAHGVTPPLDFGLFVHLETEPSGQAFLGVLPSQCDIASSSDIQERSNFDLQPDQWIALSSLRLAAESAAIDIGEGLNQQPIISAQSGADGISPSEVTNSAGESSSRSVLKNFESVYSLIK